MKAYSEELRQKVVQAVQQHGTSKSQATRLFDISFSYLKRYTRLAGRGESLTPRREVADPHQSRPNHKETARRRHTHMTDGHRDGIPRRPGRSTVLSHEGDTKPLGLGAPGPALHKAIYRGGGFAAKVAADPKAPFLNQKSPSQRAKEKEGVFCDPLHGSADSVVVAYCVEVRGGHGPWLRWRVETKGMPATLVAMGQWIEEGDREQVRV